jgi:lipid-binding SYLF domain-containing protein
VTEELADATQVLDQMTQIPMRQRQRARCVVVVPSLVRAGFVVGGRHGAGVEILSYARSRGLFAGAELSAAVVKQDTDALAAMYGASSDVHSILDGEIAAPTEAAAFLEHLQAAFPPNVQVALLQ